MNAQRGREDLSGLIFDNVFNRSCLFRGLRNAGLDIDGAESFGSFREPHMDIVFVTRLHGRRVLEAFQGGLTIPGATKSVTATPKCSATDDAIVDVLGRDTNKPVPKVQQIRDSVLAAYSVPGDQMRAEQKATNEQRLRLEQNLKAADNENAPPRRPSMESKRAVHWVENRACSVLSRENVGKRQGATGDEPLAAEIEEHGKRGHKRPRLYEGDAW